MVAEGCAVLFCTARAPHRTCELPLLFPVAAHPLARPCGRRPRRPTARCPTLQLTHGALLPRPARCALCMLTHEEVVRLEVCLDGGCDQDGELAGGVYQQGHRQVRHLGAGAGGQGARAQEGRPAGRQLCNNACGPTGAQGPGGQGPRRQGHRQAAGQGQPGACSPRCLPGPTALQWGPPPACPTTATASQCCTSLPPSRQMAGWLPPSLQNGAC